MYFSTDNAVHPLEEDPGSLQGWWKMKWGISTLCYRGERMVALLRGQQMAQRSWDYAAECCRATNLRDLLNCRGQASPASCQG